MNIGLLAKQTGLTPATIRFYERIGLLKLVDRRPNGYRTYPPEALVALNLISLAQRAGFSLDEIRTLLPADLVHWESEALTTALTRKVKDIEALEAKLAHSKTQLLSLLNEIHSRPDDMDCLANARRILSRLQGHNETLPPQHAPGSNPVETRPDTHQIEI